MCFVPSLTIFPQSVIKPLTDHVFAPCIAISRILISGVSSGQKTYDSISALLAYAAIAAPAFPFVGIATFFILMLLFLFLVFMITRLFSVLYGFPGRLLSLRNSKLVKKKQDLLHEIISSALLQDSFKLKNALKRYRKNFWEGKKNSTEKRIVCLVAIIFGEQIFDPVETMGWIDELKAVESELDVRYRRGVLAKAEFALREGKLQGLAKLLLDFLADNPKSVFGRTL